jgi:hypothetical protein
LLVPYLYFLITERELQLQALKRYEAVCARGEERLVSGSDDFTLFLWQPERDKKPVGETRFNVESNIAQLQCAQCTGLFKCCWVSSSVRPEGRHFCSHIATHTSVKDRIVMRARFHPSLEPAFNCMSFAKHCSQDHCMIKGNRTRLWVPLSQK